MGIQEVKRREIYPHVGEGLGNYGRVTYKSNICKQLHIGKKLDELISTDDIQNIYNEAGILIGCAFRRDYVKL